MRTQVWAHRGSSELAPENTIEAFSLAIAQGADGIELDVHESADGALIVIHDADVSRTTNGRGRIVDQSLAALKNLSADSGKPGFPEAKIPTLPEVYELVKPTSLTVNVEIKSDEVIYWGIWDKLLQLERDMGMTGRVIYSSFNHYALRELKKSRPTARTGLLYAEGMLDPWVYAKYAQADAIHPHYLVALLSPGLLEGCKKNGIAVHPWTADDPVILAKLFASGVEAVITNVPDVALKIRQQDSE